MAGKTATQTDAIAMLKADHDKVKELFGRFSELGDSAYKTKERIAEQVFHELETHSQLEEQVFYPAVRGTGDPEGEDLVLESTEEHHVVDVLIAELKALTPEDETFDAKFKVLCENVEHHIEEEEGEMFPIARK